jgi:hypothetical protein
VITIDDIRAEIRDGEGSVREFKATYHWSVKARQIDNDLRLEVL